MRLKFVNTLINESIINEADADNGARIKLFRELTNILKNNLNENIKFKTDESKFEFGLYPKYGYLGKIILTYYPENDINTCCSIKACDFNGNYFSNNELSGEHVSVDDIFGTDNKQGIFNNELDKMLSYVTINSDKETKSESLINEENIFGRIKNYFDIKADDKRQANQVKDNYLKLEKYIEDVVTKYVENFDNNKIKVISKIIKDDNKNKVLEITLKCPYLILVKFSTKLGKDNEKSLIISDIVTCATKINNFGSKLFDSMQDLLNSFTKLNLINGKVKLPEDINNKTSISYNPSKKISTDTDKTEPKGEKEKPEGEEDEGEENKEELKPEEKPESEENKEETSKEETPEKPKAVNYAGTIINSLADSVKKALGENLNIQSSNTLNESTLLKVNLKHTPENFNKALDTVINDSEVEDKLANIFNLIKLFLYEAADFEFDNELATDEASTNRLIKIVKDNGGFDIKKNNRLAAIVYYIRRNGELNNKVIQVFNSNKLKQNFLKEHVDETISKEATQRDNRGANLTLNKALDYCLDRQNPVSIMYVKQLYSPESNLNVNIILNKINYWYNDILSLESLEKPENINKFKSFYKKFNPNVKDETLDKHLGTAEQIKKFIFEKTKGEGEDAGAKKFRSNKEIETIIRALNEKEVKKEEKPIEGNELTNLTNELTDDIKNNKIVDSDKLVKVINSLNLDITKKQDLQKAILPFLITPETSEIK